MDTTLSTEEQMMQTALDVADQYLQSVKQWRQEEYCLEFLRVEGDPEAPLIILDGVHSGDLDSRQRGGGQSVQLTIDIRRQRVVRELAYQ